MVGIMARGRIAWILAMVFGAIGLVLGIVLRQTGVAIGGGGFLALGLLFLILSFVTGGQTD